MITISSGQGVSYNKVVLSYTMLFPLDIISQITKYLPVADAPKVIVALCPGVTNRSIHKIKNEHRDPNIFFGDIVHEIPYFIDLMTMTRTMLVGIRAFSYFHHIEIDDLEPWEFVCPRSPLCWIPFVDHLESMGVRWKVMEDTLDTRYEPRTVLLRGTLDSGMKKMNISLMWIPQGRTQIETIVDIFGMTPLQCIVTSHDAIDPYGKLHNDGMYRLWEKRDHIGEHRHLPSIHRAVSICLRSSMYPISFETHRNYNPYEQFMKRIRHFGEYDSIHVKFDATEYHPRLPIATMAWQEDAYKVVASSFVTVPFMSYNDSRTRWPKISFPRIDLEREHHQNTSKSLDPPSWALDYIWETSIRDLLTDDEW